MPSFAKLDLASLFKPENYFEVREALLQAGRQDLIGAGCDALILASPPPEAFKARREKANAALKGDHVHTMPNPARGEKAAGKKQAIGRGGSRRRGSRGRNGTAVADRRPKG